MKKSKSEYTDPKEAPEFRILQELHKGSKEKYDLAEISGYTDEILKQMMDRGFVVKSRGLFALSERGRKIYKTIVE